MLKGHGIWRNGRPFRKRDGELEIPDKFFFDEFRVEGHPKIGAGGFPRRWLQWALPQLGVWDMDGVLRTLFVCSGSLKAPLLRVDVRGSVRPTLVADGTKLPIRDASLNAALIDPPYSPMHSRRLYKTEDQYAQAHVFLKEAARVTRPGGRIGVLCWYSPSAVKRTRILRRYEIWCGMVYSGKPRIFTVYLRL